MKQNKIETLRYIIGDHVAFTVHNAIIMSRCGIMERSKDEVQNWLDVSYCLDAPILTPTGSNSKAHGRFMINYHR
jgi:hypothetical protein